MATNVKPGKESDRRELHFSSLADVGSELNRIEAAEQAGDLRAVGEWTAGQIFEHLATLFQSSLDGFSFSAPIVVRIVGKFIKRSVLGAKPIAQGVQLRGASKVLIPDTDTTFKDGLSRIRQQDRPHRRRRTHDPPKPHLRRPFTRSMARHSVQTLRPAPGLSRARRAADQRGVNDGSLYTTRP